MKVAEGSRAYDDMPAVPMALRDYFAGAALTGLVTVIPLGDESAPQTLAEMSYLIAQAMMAIRET